MSLKKAIYGLCMLSDEELEDLKKTMEESVKKLREKTVGAKKSV